MTHQKQKKLPVATFAYKLFEVIHYKKTVTIFNIKLNVKKLNVNFTNKKLSNIPE